MPRFSPERAATDTVNNSLELTSARDGGVDCAPPEPGWRRINFERIPNMELKAQFSLALAFALALGCGTAFAQDTAKSGKPLTAQQERMVDCNKEATGKTGDERKTFMSHCLKGEAAMPAAHQTQQDKMKSCSADAKAKDLKGDARKTFMSTCLKGDGAEATTTTATAKSATAGTMSQQDKMKACSADAKTKGLKGDARKTFMSTCLKGDGAEAH
jgi:psiF repeat